MYNGQANSLHQEKPFSMRDGRLEQKLRTGMNFDQDRRASSPYLTARFPAHLIFPLHRSAA